jgi:hypothetical protein
MLGGISLGRWAILTILFVIAIFMFFVGYAVGSLLLSTFADALSPTASGQAAYYMVLIPTAFGVIMALAVTIIVIVYFLESLSDEPEHYFTQGEYYK